LPVAEVRMADFARTKLDWGGYCISGRSNCQGLL
jgi:hypothetical protein